MWVLTWSLRRYVRNTTARAFSVVASALGIPALLPFLKAVCQSKKSWQARHTGIKIVQQIAILLGCAVLPHLKARAHRLAPITLVHLQCAACCVPYYGAMHLQSILDRQSMQPHPVACSGAAIALVLPYRKTVLFMFLLYPSTSIPSGRRASLEKTPQRCRCPSTCRIQSGVA